MSMTRLGRWILPAVMLFSGAVRAQTSRPSAPKLYEEVTPSLVAVQYAWADELSRRELIGAGIVVGEDLVAFSAVMTPLVIPDNQMKDFKIIVPSSEGDPEEIEAVFQGRDERTNLAFVKAKKPQHWKPIKFEEMKLNIGDRIISIGMLPQAAAYKSYYMESRVSAELRGDVPQVLVQGGGLAAMGSPVFSADGKAIGIVLFMQGQSPLLNREQEAMAAINTPPKLFVPARDFLLSLEEPPTPEHPIELPWTGLAQLTGLTKDVAEALDLKNKPAIQVGDVVPGAAGDKAGIKSGDIILKFNGKPLERGDEATELPGIFRRRLLRHKVGEEVTLTILRGAETLDIKVTLGSRPKEANKAERYFAEDLGFVVRELVFNDTYNLKLPADQKGVIVALERKQSAAQSAGLQNGDVITRLNNEGVTDIGEFQKLYKQFRKDKPREALVVVVHRRTGEDTIRIEPPQ